jgi:hypothetical protein
MLLQAGCSVVSKYDMWRPRVERAPQYRFAKRAAGAHRRDSANTHQRFGILFVQRNTWNETCVHHAQAVIG